MVSITRLMRIGIRVADWATPYVKEWHRKRHLNRNEGERHLKARNWSEAEQHFSAALAERKHPLKQNFAMLLHVHKAQLKQGKLEQAEQTVRQALEQARRARNAPLESQALGGLADLQIEQAKYGDAEKTVAEIERLERSQAKPDLARLAQSGRKLGAALLKSGRADEAAQAFERGVKLSEQAFGTNHAETGAGYAELGMLYRQSGHHPEAQRCLRTALQIHRAVLGPDSNEATQDLFHLAASLEESGDLDGAAEEYERVLKVKERQVGGNQDETADTQLRLAALYVRAGRGGKARELLTHGIGTLERKGGASLVEALELLATMEEQANRWEEAKRWREKAAAVLERA